MRLILAKWSLILLCLAMAGAVGGGFYESILVMPLWSASPPSSFAIIQPETGVLLQDFWIPVHTAITIFVVSSLILAWKEADTRKFLLIGLVSYAIMRIWSAFFFIPEMLEFQKTPLGSPASAELSARVESWTYWTWFREPLDVISLLCFLLAFFWLGRNSNVNES